MQQLSFFSFDNESIENKKAPKKNNVNVSVNKKIIDIKTKDYKVNSKVKKPKFYFELTMNRVNQLIEIDLKYSKQKLYVFNSDLELGRLLYDLFLHKPYILKDEKKVTFWEYLDIDYDSSYRYMQSFHVFNLLKTNGFKLLPNKREHIYLIYKYSDSQILEIWEYLTSNYKEVTEKNISDTIKSLEKTKELQTIESIDIKHSYSEYREKIATTHYYNMYFGFEKKNNSLSNEIFFLKKEIDILKSKINELEQLNSILFRLQGNNKFNENNNKEKDYTDFYLKVLNLKSDYTQKDLKESYNNHIKIYHPDKNINEHDNRKISFENNFKLVKEAYEYLKK